MNEDGSEAYVTVAFGTSNLGGINQGAIDLVIQNAPAIHMHGLSMATRFNLSLQKTAELPWCKEWFPIPNGRLTPIIGSLNGDSIAQLLNASENRKRLNLL